MKPSVDAIINEFALRGLETQDHELFMRRVANALNGYPKESLFFGRITKFSLKGENFLPDLWGEARKSIWNESKRNSAKMGDYSLALTENNTAICITFSYTISDTENAEVFRTNLTIRQDSIYADAFDVTVD